MPPMYQYKCKTCGQTEEVLRSLKDSDVLPGAEDSVPPAADHQHEWSKVLGATTIIKGPGWRGSKGNW